LEISPYHPLLSSAPDTDGNQFAVFLYIVPAKPVPQAILPSINANIFTMTNNSLILQMPFPLGLLVTPSALNRRSRHFFGVHRNFSGLP